MEMDKPDSTDDVKMYDRGAQELFEIASDCQLVTGDWDTLDQDARYLWVTFANRVFKRIEKRVEARTFDKMIKKVKAPYMRKRRKTKKH